jgi:trk system potassium uptake protein TrkA
MYIVISGGGVVGFNIASLLAEEAHEVVVVEQSAASLDKIRSQLDVKTIRGNAATPKVLREAEANRADLMLAVTNSDETNMVACFIAKELGAKRTAARVRNPEYSGYFLTPAKSPTSARKIIRPKSLGVDIFINPEVEVANEILAILGSVHSTPVENFADGLVQIREFRVEGEALVDKKLTDITLPKPGVIAAVVRAEGAITPDAETVIQAGDSVHVIAHRDNMDELGKVFTKPQRPAKKVVILGGGRVGLMVAEELHSRGAMVKIIESEAKRAREIAANLEGPEIIEGDGTDRNMLLEQGVPSADAFVADTQNDELDILACALAKRLGVPRSLTVVNNPNYIPLAEAVGIDVAGSPTLLAARRIAHFVLHGGAIRAALLEGKELEAIEFVVNPGAGIAGKKAAESGLPKSVVAGAIVHNGRAVIPPADHTIISGDHVIVVSPHSAIHDVEDLFK